MKRKDIKTKEGFTIIEVVLVLAIAGLIFLMVFVALPALQRSQRDTQRRDDMARVATAVDQYRTNNSGKLPSSGTCKASKDASGTSKGDAGFIKPNDNTTYDGACRFIAAYMNSTSSTENVFTDPDGWFYGVSISDQGDTATVVDAFDHVITIKKYAKCDGEQAVKSNNSRDYAILYKLEGTGTYCSDSQ